MTEDRMEVNAEPGIELAAAAPAGGNYLGDPNVVNQLVGDFFVAVLGVLEKHESDGDPDAAAQAVDALSRRYASVFLGESKAYVPMPWNHSNRLGLYVRAALLRSGAEVGTEPMVDYFNAIGGAVLAATIEHSHKRTTEAQAQETITAVRNDAVRVLLGVQHVAG